MFGIDFAFPLFPPVAPLKQNASSAPDYGAPKRALRRSMRISDSASHHAHRSKKRTKQRLTVANTSTTTTKNHGQEFSTPFWETPCAAQEKCSFLFMLLTLSQKKKFARCNAFDNPPDAASTTAAEQTVFVPTDTIEPSVRN